MGHAQNIWLIPTWLLRLCSSFFFLITSHRAKEISVNHGRIMNWHEGVMVIML